jgi:SAM-dependent methyltransferase
MFTESAHLYDAIYSRKKNYEEESSKVRAWIQKLHPTAKTVLDVACGTGEHSKYLKAHYQVDGVDLNRSFVEIAQTKNPSGTYQVSDMAKFDMGKKYDAIICLFSSIGYVATLENLNQTIRCFARHLNSGGIVLVEPWFTPDNWTAGNVHMSTVDEKDFKVCRMNVSETRVGKLSYFRFHYLIGTPEGVTHFTEDHTLGLFSIEETKLAFTKAGLSVQRDEQGIFGRGLYAGKAAIPT